MALIIGASTTSAGVAYALASADRFYLPKGEVAASTVSVGIYSAAIGNVLTIAGEVVGFEDGIGLGGTVTETGRHVVTVLEGGVVLGGDDAIQLLGFGSTVFNQGTIQGRYGINIVATGVGEGTSITNTGSIIAQNTALLLDGTKNVIVNMGLIKGSTAIYGQNISIEVVTNSGTIIGNVLLNSGADSYDGRGGTVIGTIFGGYGADRFIAGASQETFDGEQDTDTLDFSKSATGVRLALDSSFANTGTAAGDTYTNIENAFGSIVGNDSLRGTELANLFRGFGGADRLDGAAGNDILVGGLGIDTLIGGVGNDSFVFERKTDVGDKIYDFSNSSGNNDAIRIDASGFGAGLVAGTVLAASQFQIRADNLAQDANDRFIFRTTDKTLWFDANGTGTGGLLMVADLQSTAALTHLDILLV